MSAHTSPQQPTHPTSAYAQQTTPITSTPSSHLHSSTSNTFPDSAHSFASDALPTSDSESGEDASGSAPPHSSSKGKNGATGPADGKAKPHVCQICQRGFTTGGHLQRHQRIHTGVKAFKCPFPGCETRTSRQDNLQQHYRTHLSPTLRRGSGSAARAAVAAAMEAAGLKSTSSRAPRKSKGSNAGTPSSTASMHPAHLPSPYQTPTSQGGPYAPYNMYDPNQYGGYPHPLPPPGVTMAQSQSGASSRVPSPVNGHSSGHSSVSSMPGAHPHQAYFPQPFSPAYTTYPGQMHQQPYRYGPGGMPSPYGNPPPPHHSLYSSGMGPEHGQPHMYSPMNASFPTHSRESSYGVLTPGYPPNPMGNGYPPRAQTSTPLSHGGPHDDRRYPSPPRRRTPPHDMISQGMVDPNSMSNRVGLPSLPSMQTTYGGYGQPPHMPYYGTQQPPFNMGTREPAHRNSISSLSEDGSGAGGSDGSAAKATHQG